MPVLAGREGGQGSGRKRGDETGKGQGRAVRKARGKGAEGGERDGDGEGNGAGPHGRDGGEESEDAQQEYLYMSLAKSHSSVASRSVIFEMPHDNGMITDGDNEEESASVHEDEATDADHEKWACSVGWHEHVQDITCARHGLRKDMVCARDAHPY